MKRYRVLIIISVVGIISIAGCLVQLMLEYPLIGIHAKKLNDHHFVVTEIYPSGWASTKSIEPGDKLYLPGFKGNDEGIQKIEKLKSLTVIKDFQSITLNVSNRDVTAKYLFNTLFPLVFFLTNTFLSIYMLVKSKGESQYLSLFFMIVSLSYLSGGVSARDISIGSIVTSTSLFLCPVLLLHHLVNVVRSKADGKSFSRFTLPLLYLLVIFLSVITNVFYVFNRSKTYYLITFLLLIFITISLIIFHLKLFLLLFADTKFKIGFYAITLSFLPFLLLYALPEILIAEAIIPAEYTSVCLFFMPYTTLYLILNEQMVDIDYKLKRIFYYFLLSLLPALSILTMIHVFVTDNLTSIQQIRIFLICSILTVVFLCIKREYDFKIESKLFSKKLRYQDSLLNYSVNGRKSNNEGDIFYILTKEIQSVLSIDNVSQIKYCRQGQRFSCTDFNFEQDAIFLENNTNMAELQVGQIINCCSGYLVVINKNIAEYVFVYLKHRKSRMKLNKDDSIWLKTIALHTNIMLQSFTYMQDILAEINSDYTGRNTSFMSSKVLISISEEERKRLSIDIHDSILQELIFMYRELEPYATYDEGLHVLNNRLLESIRFTREACYDLRPPFIAEMGIVESITVLVERYQGREGIIIDFIHQVEQLEPLNLEVTLNIYRVIQELLNNAVKHSCADCIIISLSLDEERLLLVYEDNGIGINFKSNIDERRHFGMNGMKERVKSIDGDIVFSSGLNEGLLVKVVVSIR